MGCPEVESTDRIEGIAPVPKRVRLDPRKPSKIIAVPKLLKSNIGTIRMVLQSPQTARRYRKDGPRLTSANNVCGKCS